MHIRDITIRLLISPYLTDSDLQLLRPLTDLEERRHWLQQYGDRIVLDAAKYSEDPANTSLRSRLFTWLIASNQLQLRFALPRHLTEPGIYHEKIGVFDFAWGARVAFTGSANETFSGHSKNFESVDVFRSWVPSDSDRVAVKTAQFDTLWSGTAEAVDVVPLSARALAHVRRLAPATLPDLSVSPDSSSPELHVKVDDRWRHQDQAVQVFIERERGILEMATGTGKTRTALKIAEQLILQGSVQTVIVSTTGTDLLDQWQSELLAFVRKLPTRFILSRHYANHREGELFRLSPEQSILLASRQALPAAVRGLPTAVGARTLLVHDEVHGLGSPGNRDQLRGLSDTIRFRLGLSATTEREYDEIGTEFLEEHIGPVIFEFTLPDAIRRGILSPFKYYPLAYHVDDEDRLRLRQVYARKAAADAAGRPMSDAELWTALARVHKTSRAKLPVFAAFVDEHEDTLIRCLIFVETMEYGQEVLDIVHRYRHDFHQYFAIDESDVLERFARGELECLLTCHRLSEGIDIQNLRTVILFASARSRLETIQRIGRCLRRDPEDPHKQATVVDFIREPERGDTNTDMARAAWLQAIAEVRPEEDE